MNAQRATAVIYLGLCVILIVLGVLAESTANSLNIQLATYPEPLQTILIARTAVLILITLTGVALSLMVLSIRIRLPDMDRRFTSLGMMLFVVGIFLALFVSSSIGGGLVIVSLSLWLVAFMTHETQKGRRTRKR